MEIKDICGKILYENAKCKTLKELVEEAVTKKISLGGANLRYTDLRGAYLRGANFEFANLRYADLEGADLIGAYLEGADLRGAHLEGANLRSANLRGANLRSANLRSADLEGADLEGAYLRNADLRGAYLRGANLRNADLEGADLRGAYLRGAKNVPYIPLACPSEGPFIGWKKVENCIIKLKILENSKRSSATTNKCRCDKAKVLSITEINTEKELAEITNTKYKPLTYKVGEVAIADKFDEDRWNECSNGIHFFINKQDAINY